MIPKETIKTKNRNWKYINQSYADCFIYKDKDDMALINAKGEVECIFPDAFKEEYDEGLK